eukprot:g9156.t1
MEDPDGATRQDEPSAINTKNLMVQAQDEYDLVNELMDSHGHGIDPFRENYQQLYESGMASLESIAYARQWNDQLTAELNGHREKLGNLETYEEDAKSSRLNLLAMLETMQQLLGEVRNSEAAKKETAARLTAEIAAASSRISAGPGWTPEQEVEVKQRDHGTLRGEVSTITLHMEQKQEKERLARDRVENLEARKIALDEEVRAEVTRKGHLEELLEANQAKAKRDQELFTNQKEYLKTEAEHIGVVEEQLRASKEEMERCLSEYDELFRTIQRLSEELNSQIAANGVLQEENASKKQATEATLARLRDFEKNTRKTMRLKELAQKKIDEAESKRQEYERQRDTLKTKIHSLNSVDMKAARKDIDSLKRQIGELKREKDILERKRVSSDRAASLIYDLSKANEATLKNLSDDREAMKQSIRGLRARIEQLAGERERAEKDSLEHTRLWQERAEGLKAQGLQVADLQKKIAAAVARLKQQQNLYEAVRSDRNVYSKNLIETQDLIKETKRRFKFMNHQIEQLKDEITIMDHSLVKEHFHHHNVDKDKESLRNEVTKVKKQIVSGEHIALHQRSELQKLTRIIQEADDERQRQVKEHDAIVGEKGVLFGQLMKRNDELSLLYDKIRIQTSSLHQGEVRYQQLVNTIADLEGQIKSMERDLVQCASQAGDLNELKAASHKLEKDLRRERAKMTALVEELELPLNVHRWRKLESSDPERYDLVRKAQSLQRNIVAKTESIVKKDLLIQEKEKLYIELKNILGRQPGPEVAEQLAVYQENLKQKVKQMRAMEAELSMYKQQVDLFKSDIEAANEAMRALRHRWVAQQRRSKNSYHREGGADESASISVGAWDSPSPAARATASADSIPLLLQDGGRGNIGSESSLRKGTLDGDTPEGAAREVLPPVAEGRRRARRVAQAKGVVGRGVRLLLAIDIGSSSVRCSAYTVGSPPLPVPGCTVQLKHAVVKKDGAADAEEVVDLVDEAVDRCFSELRALGVSHAVTAVGFACFGMNLVGVGEDGKPCTPVFTYAANSNPSPSHSSASAPTPTSTPTTSPAGDPSSAGFLRAGYPAGAVGSGGSCPSSVEDDVMKRLREALERTGLGGKGGLEEARRRTGAPTHVSYAPAQLLRWLRRRASSSSSSTTTATATATATAPVSAATTTTGTREGEGEGEGSSRVQQRWRRQQQLQLQGRRRVRVWQTLPSLIAARWCRLASAPVSYSEASWMGLLDLRRLEWDAPTLAVLAEAGFDCSALPPLADVEGLRAGASGAALKRWPELDGASIRLGLGDGAAACLGSGCDETSGLIAATVGTSAAARVVLPLEGENERRATTAAATSTPATATTFNNAPAAAGDDGAAPFRVPRGLWCYRLDRRRVVLGGALTDGGSVFEWLRGTLGLAPGEDTDAVMREVEGMPPNGHGLVILPFFSGERSPGYKDDATACILGLRRSTTRAQLVRAGLESVCLRLAAIVDLMAGDIGGGGDGSGGAPWLRRDRCAEVVTSGNAFAASPFWRQILADCLGRTVRASGVTEETSLGVAILLSSLEGHQAPRRAAAGAGAAAAATTEVAGGSEAKDAAVPTKSHNAAYAEAGLAQERAYRAVFGTAGGGSLVSASMPARRDF